MQINFCTPQFFFNVSQRFPFLVYDLREHQNGYLKNSIHTIDIFGEVDELNKHFKLPEQQSEKQRLLKLYNTRKRNYNFLVPFDASDMFSLIFRDRVKEKSIDLVDQYTMSQECVTQLWYDITRKLPYRKQHKLRSRAATMVFQDDDDEIVESQLNIQGFVSSKKVIELQEITISNGPKLRQRSASQPRSSYHQGNLYQNSEFFGAALKVYEVLHKEKVRQVYILLDPIQIVFANHPFLNYEIPKNRGFLDKTFPNEIIENKLYLGGGDHAKDIEMLTDILGITHIVNATKEIQNYCQQLKYLKIEILDEPQINISQYFNDVYKYIDNALQEGGKVLVHCAQGKSRSACLVVMYLMRKFQWTFEKAYDFVKECREIVCINDGFINQLLTI